MPCFASTLSLNASETYIYQSRPTFHRPGSPQGLSSDDSRLVSAQTGALLVAIGILLMNLYPFREHVDPHTGEMLVKIGRKLTGE